MNGQPESLIEQAVLQGRHEADQLYMLVVEVNCEIVRSMNPRHRESILLWAHLQTAVRAQCLASVERLREGVGMLVEEVVSLPWAIWQIAAAHFEGREILFRDTKRYLEQQLETTFELCACFNAFARDCGSPELDYVKIREDLGAAARNRVSSLLRYCRLTTLELFADVASTQQAIAEFWREYKKQQTAAELTSESPRAENDAETTDECSRFIAKLAQKARAELQIDTMI